MTIKLIDKVVNTVINTEPSALGFIPLLKAQGRVLP